METKKKDECLIPGCTNKRQAESPHCEDHQPFLPGLAKGCLDRYWDDIKKILPDDAPQIQVECCKQFYFIGIQTGLRFIDGGMHLLENEIKEFLATELLRMQPSKGEA